MRSSIGNGGVSDAFSTSSVGRRRPRSRRSPSCRVASCPRVERATEPVTRTTSSAPRRWPSRAPSAAASGWNTTCTAPSRSRRSMNVTPPWSRRRATQPQRVTSVPASPGRSSPHACVRIVVRMVDRSDVMSLIRSSRPVLEPGQPAGDIATRHCLLHAVDEAAERHRAVGELALPHDRRERGARAVGHLELGLQRPFLVGVRRRRSRRSEAHRRASSRRRAALSPIATTKQLGARRRRRGAPSPSMASSTRSRPIANPTPGVARTAERLGEAVVAAPGVHRAGLVAPTSTPRRSIRTPCACSSRARAPAGDRARTSTPAASSPARTAAKCAAHGVAEVIGDRGRAPARSPCSPSTLQSKTRSGFVCEPVAAVLVESVAVRLEVRDSAPGTPAGRRRRRSSSGAAHVDEPAVAQEPVAQRDHLDVGARRSGADHLDAELAELAHSGPPAVARGGTRCRCSSP